MKKRIKETDESINFEVVKDFLPPPAELVRRTRRVKVTLEVGAPTVALFRKKAGRASPDYRKVMGELLDYYATLQR